MESYTNFLSSIFKWKNLDNTLFLLQFCCPIHPSLYDCLDPLNRHLAQATCVRGAENNNFAATKRGGCESKSLNVW
jgi:hypothetical protein